MSERSTVPPGDPGQRDSRPLQPLLDQEEICTIEEMVHACSRLACPIGRMTDEDGYPPPPSPGSRPPRP